MIVVDDLTGGYGGIDVLHGLHLEVAPGRITGLIGPNGAGKSSLLRAIYVGLPRLTGTVTLDDRQLPINSSQWRASAVADIAYVPEGRGILPSMTVNEHLLIGAKGRKDLYREGAERVQELFPVLKDRLGQRAGTLSGGEQQMLALARCMMTNPPYLLVDEPSLGLAPLTMLAVFEHLRTICESQRTGIILAEQNAAMLRMCDLVAVLVGGRIVREAAPGELDADTLFSMFLGDAEATSAASGGHE